VSYSLNKSIAKESAEFAATRPQVVKETARRLSNTGADILKLEFPVDVAFDRDQNSWHAACQAVSAVSAVPWVLLSAGVDFETFADQTYIACQEGASGFLAGRAIWKESVALPTNERKQFIQNVAIPRLNALTEIATQKARSWRQFYIPMSASENWYERYN
jgi:tagatose 1,6-diphosphate aldolase